MSQRVPWPPDRGDRITTWHVLRHLLGQGASVRVGCLAESDRDEEMARELAPQVEALCAPRIHRGPRKLLSLSGLLTGQALNLIFFGDRRLRAQVARWLAEDPPDLIYVYSASMAQHVMPSGQDQSLRVMQFAELDSDKYRQYAEHDGPLGGWIYGREADKLLEFERQVARAFDVSLVVSDVEKELFMKCIPDVEPTVVPNGVDVDHFSSSGDENRDPHTLIFSGVMNYEPNVEGIQWFVRDCWEPIRAAHPDARLLIVGSHPTREIRELAEHPGIEVTGRVPETPPYFDRAAVALAPLRLARGVQNKVLEAMSMGLPIVASPQASQGLGDVPHDTLLRAEGRDATVAAVCRLLDDPSEARMIGERAAAFVRSRYRWEQMLARFDAAIDEARRS